MGNLFAEAIKKSSTTTFQPSTPVKPQPIQEWEDQMSNAFAKTYGVGDIFTGFGLSNKIASGVKNLFADEVKKNSLNFELPAEIKEPDPWFQSLPDKEKTAFVRSYGERAIYKEQLDKIYDQGYQQRQAELKPAALPSDYKEPGLWGQAVDEVKSSSVQVAQSAAATLEKVGIKFNSEALEGLGANTADKLQQVILNNPEWQPPEDMGKWKDPRFYVRGIANFIPSMVASLGAAAIGTVAAGPVGGIAAGYASAASLEGGSSFREGQEAGVALSDNIKASDTIGRINGALELLPIGRFLNKTGAGKELKEKLVGRIVKEFVGQGLEEGSTEAMQQVVSNVVMQDYIEDRSTWDGVLESFVFGFGSGAGMGAVGQVGASPEVAQGLKEISEDTRGSVPADFGLGDLGKKETTPGIPEQAPAEKPSEPLIEEANEIKPESPKDSPETLRRAFEDATREVESPVKSEDEQKRAFEALKSSVPTEIAKRIKKASKLSVYAEERMLDEYKKTGQLPKEAMSQTDHILEAQADRQIQSEVYKSEVAGYSSDDIKLFDQVRRVKESKKEFAEGDFETMRQDPTWGQKVEQALERYRTGEKDGMDDVTAFEEIMNLPSLKEIRMADKGLTLKERRAMRKEEAAALSKRLDTAEQKLLDKDTKEATAEDVRGAIIDYAKTILPVSERGPLLGWVKNAKTMKDFEKAMGKIDELADAYEQKLQAEKYIEERAREMKEIGKFFNLSAEDLKKISKKDIRYMDATEYAAYLDEIKIKAVEFAQTKEAKLALMNHIHTLNLKNWQNLQKAMELPSVSEMTKDQMNQFLEALQPYQYGDVFLSVRKLETVDRTDLKGIKTIREARERLSDELGMKFDELDTIKFEDIDRMRFDTALAEKDPFHKMMVEETNKRVLEADAAYLEDKERFLELYKAAVKSRPKSLKEKAVQMLIPQQKQIVEYLEATPERKAELGGQLSTQEMDLAHYMMEHYRAVMDYHVAIEAEFGTRFGDDNYYTHIRRGILESVKEDGIVKAFKNLFESYRQDAAVFNILDERTNTILPLEKFFQYSLRRSEQLGPSFNVSKSFLTYMKTFRKKQMFDRMIPKLDIYANSLERQMETPRGLEMDKAASNFVKEWVNNKKGRRTKLIAKQGSRLDLVLRSAKTFVSIMDLGLSIPLGIATQVGEQVTTYETIGKKAFVLGTTRQMTKEGRAILKKYENFIGENPWKELVEPGKGGGDRLMEGLFIFFRDASVRANKTLLLGLMTKEEFAAGEISTEKLSELNILKGRWRDVEGSHSIIGATPEIGILKQYYGWAIPIARTMAQDSMALLRTVTRLGDSGKRLSKQQALELWRLVEVGGMIAIAGMFAGDEDDDSFVGELKKKAYRELSTLFQAVTPDTWVRVPRTMQFLIDFNKYIGEIVRLETYKTGEREGQLKGTAHLKKMFTPKIIRQFMGDPAETKKAEEITKGLNLGSERKLNLGGRKLNLKTERKLNFGSRKLNL